MVLNMQLFKNRIEADTLVAAGLLGDVLIKDAPGTCPLISKLEMR